MLLFMEIWFPFILTDFNIVFQELVFSASPDTTIRVWGIQQRSCAQVIRAHEGAVTGISLHATGDYLLSSSTDGVSTPYSMEMLCAMLSLICL